MLELKRWLESLPYRLLYYISLYACSSSTADTNGWSAGNAGGVVQDSTGKIGGDMQKNEDVGKGI